MASTTASSGLWSAFSSWRRAFSCLAGWMCPTWTEKSALEMKGKRSTAVHEALGLHAGEQHQGGGFGDRWRRRGRREGERAPAAEMSSVSASREACHRPRFSLIYLHFVAPRLFKKHYIMVPPGVKGRVKSVMPAGKYKIETPVVEVEEARRL